MLVHKMAQSRTEGGVKTFHLVIRLWVLRSSADIVHLQSATVCAENFDKNQRPLSVSSLDGIP